MQSQKRALKVLATKRKAERVKSSFSGAIITDEGFLCHCVITDVSSLGMQLSLLEVTKLPEVFSVKTPAVADTLHVKKVWESGKKIGVEIHVDDSVSEEAC